MLESRESLQGEAHHKQPHPAEDLGVPVGVDFLKRGRRKRARPGDPQQQDHAPGRAQREHHRDAGTEERAVDAVGRRLDESRLSRLLGVARLDCLTNLSEQLFQRHIMGAGEELQ